MKTYLTVPYKEKDEARRNGARFDLARKKWFVENLPDLEPFLKWMPEHMKLPSDNLWKHAERVV
jgi:hypothetical protein